MAPASIVHIVRHAEGFHQLPRDHPNVLIRDPSLTRHGIEQSELFNHRFPFHDQIDLLCASPLRRTIQTASLAFEPELDRGLKIVAVSGAQEQSDAPSDTGSDPSELLTEFGDMIDISLLTKEWYVKTGINGTEEHTLRDRARRLRGFLRQRPECVIVLVTHGAFTHFITEHVDPEGHQTGTQRYHIGPRFRITRAWLTICSPTQANTGVILCGGPINLILTRTEILG